MSRWFLITALLCSGCTWIGDEARLTYTVVRGDTLTKVSKAYGVTVEDLQRWNELTGDQIEVGQVLTIEAGGLPAQRVEPKARVRKPAAKPSSGSRGMPKPKPCLEGPSLDELDLDDVDIQGSEGLSVAQVRGPMKTFLPTLGGCFSGGWPTAVVNLEITVACTGLVSDIRVLDGAGLEGPVLNCMTGGLSRVAFPAHDIDGGFSFRYPINISP
jgi:hypothetical protein